MVFKRVGDMITATIHEGLDRMENPRVMLNQYLRDMEDELAKAKHAIVKQQTLEKNFRNQWNEVEKIAAKRKSQAQTAFDAGEENLARKALAEMKHYEAKSRQYSELSAKASQQVRELREQLHELEERFQTLKDKKYALIARANAVRAKEHMLASMNRIDSESAFKEFQRLEDRIAETELKVDAWANVGSTHSLGEFAKLEYADEVEKELSNMRQTKSQSSGAEKTPDEKQAN